MGQPGPNLGGFVRGEVVQDDVHVEICRDLLVELWSVPGIVDVEDYAASSWMSLYPNSYSWGVK